MLARSLLLVALTPLLALAEEPSAKVITFSGYKEAIELKQGTAKAVLCPQAGGRVLEFSIDGNNAMYLDDDEKNWKPGKPASISAGRSWTGSTKRDEATTFLIAAFSWRLVVPWLPVTRGSIQLLV